MKKVLGLDLGTTSIGWGLVYQAENSEEQSFIIKAGVRVNPLSVDEKDAFEKGRAVTTNSDRSQKRSMRRNRQRFQLRRKSLIEILTQEGWINEETILTETGNFSTFETYRLRAEAVEKEISLEELARVLLMINKKRGYKSSRKTDKAEDGKLIDGMSVAKVLAETGITPAQYCLDILRSGKKSLPEFYRSDLQAELDRIWDTQKQFYPDVLSDELKEKLAGKSKTNSAKTIYAITGISTADNKGKDKRSISYQWRVEALSARLDSEILAYVISDLVGEISNSSGYLGSISDRSKELVFSGKTIGQYLYDKIKADSHFRTHNLVFYRQDYMEEFNRIWSKQSEFHPEMTEALRQEIRDKVVFYQRNLKSQKGLVSFCEFEQKPVQVIIDGKERQKIRGCRVAPRSSILFQDFKMWQILNNLTIYDKKSGMTQPVSLEDMNTLAEELTVKGTARSSDILKMLGLNPRQYELNYKQVEGNSTMSEFYRNALEIVDLSGHGEYDITKMTSYRVKEVISEVFGALGFDPSFLSFDSSLTKEMYEQQKSFKLWHLLYSYDGDGSNTGDASLISKIGELCALPVEYAKVIAGIHLADDYGSLSHKAICKILPYLKSGYKYDVACEMAGYRHSKSSLTKEELDSKILVDKLDILPKGSLRNPVVEKIINQMINVVNAVSEEYGRPDEIHIEMARELKKTARQRSEDVQRISTQTRDNEKIVKILHSEFGIKDVSRNDIIRYRLYEELKVNGYKTLYSGQYIPRDLIFSDTIDIEHIIPQALYFDDSFANKTLEYRSVNLEKGKMTARDYVFQKYGDIGLEDYHRLVDDLFARGVISKGKHFNLLCKQEEIPADFLNRDLSNSQYIAKKATEILGSYVRDVVTTTGSITARLREDWQLVDVMKEINMPKYQRLGLTHSVERNGREILKINDWTKRNDHRHHAMDAITIAFTKPSHIQYLNNLSAGSDKNSNIYGIRQKETMLSGSKRIFVPPMPLDQLRAAFKRELEAILVSFKSNGKVATRNINAYQTGSGMRKIIQLTPRGQLHKETVYGLRKQYELTELPIGSKMTAEVIATVASKAEREALLTRLEMCGGDARQAFTGKNSPAKSPIWLDAEHTRALGSKVKCVSFKEVFSVRKEISPDLNVDKVIDSKIRRILKARLEEYGGDPKLAFVNLDENPVFLDPGKKLPVKKVTIAENIPAVALRTKKDHRGKEILDDNGTTMPVDYVNLRNNHHVAIYRDAEGRLQEKVVTFFEALDRVSQGLPAVDRTCRKDDGWKFAFSMMINEMFIFPDAANGFDPRSIDLTDKSNYSLISPHLFRVQKLSQSDYFFTHHLETTVQNDNVCLGTTWMRVRSLYKLEGVVKVRITNTGTIIIAQDD